MSDSPEQTQKPQPLTLRQAGNPQILVCFACSGANLAVKFSQLDISESANRESRIKRGT
jgi:hypothetical protein